MPSVFTHIINGQLPGHFVWQDPDVVAFLTIQPFRDGHVLVVPRMEIDHFDDVPEEIAARLMVVSQRIARALKAVYRPARVGMLIAGLEVPHTHLHLVPIDELGELSFANASGASAESLAENASRIREALRAQGNTEADF